MPWWNTRSLEAAPRRSGRYRVITLLVALAATPGTAAHAQFFNRFLPDREFMPPILASPREPVTMASFVFVARSATLFEEMLEGQAAVGISLPFFRIQGDTPDRALVLGVQGGAFARFAMEPSERDLISTDWVFGLPLVWKRGHHWLRLRYIHRSSHLGDEYIERFEVERIPYGRDAMELMGLIEVVPGLGAYAGGRFGYAVEPLGTGRWTLQGGVQTRGLSLGGSLEGYAAVDLESEQGTHWTPRLNVQVGVRLDRWRGRGLRLAAEFFTGPSPQGQFFEERETFVTLGLYLDL